MNDNHVSLPGSFREPLAAAQVLGPVAASTPIEVTLVLRRRVELPAEPAPGGIDSADLATRFGADPADVDLVTRTVTEAGARVIQSDPASRRVRISGTAGTLQALFGTTLQRARVTDPDGRSVDVRHRTGELSVPAALAGVVTAVLGLDDRPQARALLRVAPAAGAGTSYTPPGLAKIYRMPADTDGTGQMLAIIELGGGFGQSDLDTYFSGLGIATPTVTAVGVDGAVNTAGQDPQGADGEVLLDIEVAGAIAPKAGIVVYFAPNTDAGFLDAVSTAAHATPTPSAMSISWGQSEDAWTAQARTAMDQAFADATAMGVSVTAAAGDSGSSDTPTGGAAVHVDFPASSPHVLACGGTSLVADPATGSVTSESVWNNGPGNGATGGGVSDTFGQPSWQATAGVPNMAGRGVPDVAADADPRTGYQVFVDGKAMVFGGTSAVAPLWAALVCRLCQSLGHRLGLLQPVLYAAAQPGVSPAGFRDITSGNNGHYQAAAGWDPCTGLGVPDGTALLAVLAGTHT
ncbi:MAG: kumamolisin [Pseudonocardiales bacterium]|nr:kumamolisin [Pseudonocardiales bacterium]